MRLIGCLNIIGASLKRSFEYGIRVTSLGRVANLAYPIEEEADSTGLRKISVIFGECRAHLGGRPISVIRQRFDDQRDAARSVPLVSNFLEIGAVAVAGPARDGPIEREGRNPATTSRCA